MRIIIREAKESERRYIVMRTGKELASDACVVVWLDARLVGWVDDYGTFYAVPTPTSDGRLEAAGEALFDAAAAFWEADQ